ncbi:YceI family protein [Aliarcobacter cryaerophilus]|uniref:YceI family protein n=1 Tax=Aliarcobacter cryaerophilus TaxID=28198 RepID=UPI0021B216D2|nr:YceI family protein [Aliarcobacter cryaerophilus]MCT7469179.1 YceI family protein [Aliarcobacter cryaerophilus]
MKKITLGLLSIFTASSLFAGTYSVDTSHSTAGFSVKHMMVTNVVGKIKDISGTYEYDEKANTLLSVQGELNVASIDTADEKRDAHLKADDILDVVKFPKISFKSTKVEKDVVYGDLTIKGITKNIKLNLENGGSLGKKSGFSLTGKINRSEFGVTWNKILETGGVAVSDEVKLNIDIEGNLTN